MFVFFFCLVLFSFDLGVGEHFISFLSLSVPPVFLPPDSRSEPEATHLVTQPSPTYVLFFIACVCEPRVRECMHACMRA